MTIAVPVTGPPISPATTCSDGSHTNGCFYGWAGFHVTGIFKSGNDSNVDGWFLPAPAGNLSLSDTNCSGTTCPPIGPLILKLNLVN